MRKLSVFQVVVLSIFGALAVSGLLIFALAVSVNESASVGSVVVWGTENEGIVTNVISQTADKDPRLAQVTYVEKDPKTYEEELTEALAQGGGPDLFFLRQDYIVKDAGKIAPVPLEALSKQQFDAAFIEAARPFYTSLGALGIPLFADPLVLYWNRDILSAAGYAQPPVYWGEVPEMAQKITVRRSDGSISRATIPLGEYANVAHAKDILSALILQAGGAITAYGESGLSPALTGYGTESSQAAEDALRFYTEFANPSKVDYSWSRSLPLSRRAFIAGDSALYIGYASEAAGIALENPNLNFAIARFPQIKDIKQPRNVARVTAAAISRASGNQTGARTVAGILASRELALSEALGVPSASRQTLALPGAGYMDLFNKEALISLSWLDPDPQKTDVIFRAMIEGVTSGAVRLSEAVQRANGELGQLLGM